MGDNGNDSYGAPCGVVEGIAVIEIPCEYRALRYSAEVRWVAPWGSVVATFAKGEYGVMAEMTAVCAGGDVGPVGEMTWRLGGVWPNDEVGLERAVEVVEYWMWQARSIWPDGVAFQAVPLAELLALWPEVEGPAAGDDVKAGRALQVCRMLKAGQIDRAILLVRKTLSWW